MKIQPKKTTKTRLLQPWAYWENQWTEKFNFYQSEKTQIYQVLFWLGQGMGNIFNQILRKPTDPTGRNHLKSMENPKGSHIGLDGPLPETAQDASSQTSKPKTNGFAIHNGIKILHQLNSSIL